LAEFKYTYIIYIDASIRSVSKLINVVKRGIHKTRKNLN